MGYADIGSSGTTQRKTPNLDCMAHKGMKLTPFYAAPVCSGSRAEMMTGCDGERVSSRPKTLAVKKAVAASPRSTPTKTVC